MNKKTILFFLLIVFCNQTYSFNITPKQILGGSLGISVILTGNYLVRKIEKTFNIEVPIGLVSFPSLFIMNYVLNLVPPFRNKNKLDRNIFSAEQSFRVQREHNKALIRELYMSKFAEPMLNIIRKSQIDKNKELDDELDQINQIDKEIRADFYKKFKTKNFIPSLRFLYFKTPGFFDLSKILHVSSKTKLKMKTEFLPEYISQINDFRSSLAKIALARANNNSISEQDIETFKRYIFQ